MDNSILCEKAHRRGKEIYETDPGVQQPCWMAPKYWIVYKAFLFDRIVNHFCFFRSIHLNNVHLVNPHFFHMFIACSMPCFAQNRKIAEMIDFQEAFDTGQNILNYTFLLRPLVGSMSYNSFVYCNAFSFIYRLNGTKARMIACVCVCHWRQCAISKFIM